jgi:hypothetical protein
MKENGESTVQLTKTKIKTPKRAPAAPRMAATVSRDAAGQL